MQNKWTGADALQGDKLTRKTKSDERTSENNSLLSLLPEKPISPGLNFPLYPVAPFNLHIESLVALWSHTSSQNDQLQNCT